MLRRFCDWLFRNRHTGRITIGQVPNLPLTLFGLATAMEWWLRPEGVWGTTLTIAARACLAWWAADEVLRGVNPWRRILGATVLGYLWVVTLEAAR